MPFWYNASVKHLSRPWVAALFAVLFLAACGTDSPAGPTCHLIAGDLAISEIMANPSGDDTGREWFEVYNTTSKTLDLAGVTLVAAKSDMSGEKDFTIDKLTVAPKAYVVFGSATQDLKPAYVTYGYGAALGQLINTNGLVAVKCGATVVDQVTYATAPDGASLEVTGTMAPDALANDDASQWCAATASYETGNSGTPGAANEACSGTGPQGMCTDAGGKRAVRTPAVGDLVVSELMPDPNGTDTAGEWFEVYVVRDVDLNGLGLGTAVGTVKDTLVDTSCLAATAGSYLVFARSTDATTNGGLPSVYKTESLTLGNTSGTVVLSVNGTVIDQVSYTKAPAGASLSLDPAKLDANANDDPTAFCSGVATYGAGGKGTPGAANPPCH